MTDANAMTLEELRAAHLPFLLLVESRSYSGDLKALALGVLAIGGPLTDEERARAEESLNEGERQIYERRKR